MASRIEGHEAALKLELAQRERAERQYADLAIVWGSAPQRHRRCDSTNRKGIPMIITRGAPIVVTQH